MVQKLKRLLKRNAKVHRGAHRFVRQAPRCLCYRRLTPQKQPLTYLLGTPLPIHLVCQSFLHGLNLEHFFFNFAKRMYDNCMQIMKKSTYVFQRKCLIFRVEKMGFEPTTS